MDHTAGERFILLCACRRVVDAAGAILARDMAVWAKVFWWDVSHGLLLRLFLSLDLND
jgi:hypothetical protein